MLLRITQVYCTAVAAGACLVIATNYDNGFGSHLAFVLGAIGVVYTLHVDKKGK